MSVLHCADLSTATLHTLLSAKLAQAPAFFLQAPIVLNLADVNQLPDFTSLKNLFTELKLVLVGVTAANAEQKTAAHAAGLAVLQAGKAGVKAQPTTAAPQTAINTTATDSYGARPLPAPVAIPASGFTVTTCRQNWFPLPAITGSATVCRANSGANQPALRCRTIA